MRRYVCKPPSIQGENMSFKSWRAFLEFSHTVKHKSRYILDDDSKAFLDAVADTCGSRAKVLEKGTVLWRAQNGHDWEEIREGDEVVAEKPSAFSPTRMKPLVDSASEGRANSKGIPCLYLATTANTAMSEVRPWLGSIISAGQFETIKELKIVDCSIHHGEATHFFFQEPPAEDVIKNVWAFIDNAFSQPTLNNDLRSDYAPTQMIAELFKSLGYDGLAYKSSLSDGYNIALFDLESAKLVNCSVFEAKKVEFSFNEIDNPYFIKDT
ncbi:RES family NAD+ phosphorylase [Vibrio sp. ART SEL2]|nr:RES family NAD+ phosphorylase [Vibrio sp. ART SEL2]MDA0100847.1 RES family NAD+ phosphorylase [Vibrio sp. ART SEL2]